MAPLSSSLLGFQMIRSETVRVNRWSHFVRNGEKNSEGERELHGIKKKKKKLWMRVWENNIKILIL
jgi:hypothetical protein